MKIKEWLKKREQAKYDKMEQEFNQMYLKIPTEFIEIHHDTPTAYVALVTYKSMIDVRGLLYRNVKETFDNSKEIEELKSSVKYVKEYKQERLALQSEYKCMDNRFKHLANLIGHLQEEVTRLSEELEEEKAKHIQVD